MTKEKDGDFITVYTNDGKKEEAELVGRFEIKNLGDYVIYKINEEFYGAKYEINEGNTKLITDLTDQEKEALNEAFLKLEVE